MEVGNQGRCMLCLLNCIVVIVESTNPVNLSWPLFMELAPFTSVISDDHTVRFVACIAFFFFFCYICIPRSDSVVLISHLLVSLSCFAQILINPGLDLGVIRFKHLIFFHGTLTPHYIRSFP